MSQLPSFSRFDPLARLALALLLGAVASAARADEGATYKSVVQLRDLALEQAAPRTGPAADAFVAAARKYVQADGPDNAHRDRVRVWLGWFLETRDVRAAYQLYRQANSAAARQHEARLRARHEPPPPLTMDRWIGIPIHPQATKDDVVALIFLSVSHPQTRSVWPRLLRLHQRLPAKGCRLAVVATVIDDRDNQRPERIEAAIKRLRPPFAVGIDKQSRRGPSTTLRAYRGASLPWAAVIDRYGRLAWSGGVPASANALQQFEQRITTIVEQPSFATLVKRVRSGDTKALATLCGIRTKATMDHLLALHAKPGSISHALVANAIRGLGPAHLALMAEAPAWWKRERQSFRYSLEQNRLVRQR